VDLLKYLTGELRLSIVKAWKRGYGFNEDELLDIFDKLGSINSKQELLRSLFNINENTSGKICSNCKFYVLFGDSYVCKKWMMLIFSPAGNPVPITDRCHKRRAGT